MTGSRGKNSDGRRARHATLAAATLVFGVGGCANVDEPHSQATTPSQETAPPAYMTYEQAEATIKGFHGSVCPIGALWAPDCNDTIRVDITDAVLTFVYAKGDGKSGFSVPVSELRAEAHPSDAFKASIIVNGSKELIGNDGSNAEAYNLAAGLNQLPLRVAEREWSVKAYMSILARAYRSLPVKPVPGEDVRAFTVQARNAIENKRFADAARLYYKALRIAPWWPAGHHDAAFILAELGLLRNAASELSTYLELVPNAPDARAMQDQIYVWQGQDRSIAPPVPAPARWRPQPGRGRLGVEIQSVPPIVAEANHRPDTGGALVVAVAEGSPAAAAGLMSGDIVVTVASHRIMAPADLVKTVQASVAGTDLPITIIRDGRQSTINVRL